MRRIIGAAFVSLDGVMQAPGGPTEDWTGGFSLGGWLPALGDEAIGDTIGALFARPFDLLLGRRTYDIFAGYWPYAQGENKPMGEMSDRVGKYVVTHSDEPLAWQNSHRVATLDALADLKRGEGVDLVIQGSSTLYPQLLAAGLLDRLTLMIFPVILGGGKRLLGDGTPPGTMKLVDQRVSSGGNIVATYKPAGAVVTGNYAVEEQSAAEKARQARMGDGNW